MKSIRLKKISSTMLEYAFGYLKAYSEQKNDRQNIYRVVEANQEACGQYKLIIQIIGKSTVFECSPQEIVTNDKMLEGFSKLDIRNITYFACEKPKKPKYKVIMQEFYDGFNKIIFKLRHHGTNEVILRTAGQISIDKKLINDLSHEDVCSISYAAGYEQSNAERCMEETGIIK